MTSRPWRHVCTTAADTPSFVCLTRNAHFYRIVPRATLPQGPDQRCPREAAMARYLVVAHQTVTSPELLKVVRGVRDQQIRRIATCGFPGHLPRTNEQVTGCMRSFRAFIADAAGAPRVPGVDE
jgi:hypothetical protein